MLSYDEVQARFTASHPNLQITRNEPLAAHTRFALGGPAALFLDANSEDAFLLALQTAASSGLPWIVIGLGTNLVVEDAGFDGIVIRYSAAAISASGHTLTAQAGAPLQSLVDFSLSLDLAGLESLTGIPGNVGAAVYGNAGAYGRSLSDFVTSVRYFDGAALREASFEACGFRYRESEFKRRRLRGEPWLILSASLCLEPGDGPALREKAASILATRNAKFPPELRCAGSTFKNLLVKDLPPAARAALPESVIKGGKAPAAWFLEQVGAKGMAHGGIRVTDYHANTLYNAGAGTAAHFRALVAELKTLVRARFGFDLEEEVQYIGGQP